tara:strand:- start:123 stop:758 length:636 start_codon:yes stop_codon:yes gene_type:complete
MENIITSKLASTLKDITNKYPGRILDVFNSFNDNQYRCKNWLVEKLNEYPFHFKNKSQEQIDIAILGGWYGLLGELLLNNYKTKPIRQIVSYDIDPIARKIGSYFSDKVKFQTMDIKDITFKSKSYSICINTSCEHMEQKLIDETIDKMTEKTLVVLQSNDYEELDQHINCVKDLTTFVKQYENKLEKIQAFSLYITKEDYNRFMILGVRK